MDLGHEPKRGGRARCQRTPAARGRHAHGRDCEATGRRRATRERRAAGTGAERRGHRLVGPRPAHGQGYLQRAVVGHVRLRGRRDRSGRRAVAKHGAPGRLRDGPHRAGATYSRRDPDVRGRSPRATQRRPMALDSEPRQGGRARAGRRCAAHRRRQLEHQRAQAQATAAGCAGPRRCTHRLAESPLV